jgi:hypothetical protein
MNRLIYITEQQLHEIIGNGAYLNQQDTTNEYRFGGEEISVDGVTGDYIDGNINLGNPVTTDRISKRITKPRVRGMARTVLPESNQDLTGKQNTFQLSNDTIDSIKQSLNYYNGNKNEPGVKRGEKIIKDKRISYDDGYRILDDFETGRAGSILDPDGKLQKEIRRKLDTAENISKNDKEAKMKRGENILKSAPKTGLKGGAHTPTGNNTIGITYQN